MIHAILTFLVLVLAVVIPSAAVGDELTPDEINRIIKEIDELYRANSSRGSIEMEIITPHWQRTLEMDIWSKGMDRTFARINAPAKERGVGSLRIGNEMWNYLPKTNKVIKIPPSMMMSSWMGSDFTNDDLVKEFSLFEDYRYETATVEDPDPDLIYINCIPREDLPIVWGNIIIAARRSDHIPIWQRYYDEKGELMRVMEYSEVREFDGRRLPSVMAMVPQNKEGHKTIMRYTSLSFNIDLGDDVFSLRNLRSRE